MLNEIERYVTKEIELFGRRRAAIEAIEATEQAAGVALLDASEGESTAAQTDAIVRAKSELAAINAAITACRQRRLQAVREKRATEAKAARKQADELRGQLEQLEEKTAGIV